MNQLIHCMKQLIYFDDFYIYFGKGGGVYKESAYFIISSYDSFKLSDQKYLSIH